MRRIAITVVLLVVGCAVAYAARRRVLTAIGGFLIVRNPPRRADAIVVLSGSLPDRILEAVDLYQEQWAPRIILTREAPPPGFEAARARGATLPEHHEQQQAIAEQLGVPPTAIAVMPTRTTSTFAEAQALVAYLRAEHINSILLVTSNAHARRSRLIFRALAHGNPTVAIHPSRYDPFAADTWWEHRAFVRRVVIEYGKLMTYLLIDQWRI